LHPITVGMVDCAKAEFGLRFADPSLTCDELGHENGQALCKFCVANANPDHQMSSDQHPQMWT